MRKLVLFMAVALLVFAGTAACYAADDTGKFSLGVKAGAGIPMESNEDTGFGVVADGYYGLNKYIDVGIEGSWQRIAWGSYGDLDVFPVLFNVRLKASDLINEKFTPYLVAGIGAAFMSVEEKTDYKMDIDPGLATKIGGGLEYKFTDNLALDAEVCYVYIASDAEVQYKGVKVQGQGHQDYIYIGAGLRYYF